ncbi:dienelactone hydrolase family protein [Acuticoccus sp. M5D2P5]|uniref:dienelactone hydrolase family protein n=1 Tax=Acuticoccus kalidii TaxID=2910977 RepID=UPI001F1684A8|nr:dienelactone hydrolase family protein [Acuticoccus kalidii]MCF3932267.1 dienelactone hydrolase family protein [Acuticoccus kalidii]
MTRSTPPRRLAALSILAVFAATATVSAAGLAPDGRWPSADVTPMRPDIASASPFTLTDVGGAAAPIAANVTYYPADGASAENPAPAVILLHGAGGVSQRREGRYAREFAAQGIATAVIDVFGAREGGGFVERLMKTTEAMALSDAFATLDWLADRPEIDADRVALIGFSYGGMSSIYAAYRQVVDTYRPDNAFAAHVAFYGPCIARFEDATTTGAPILMLWGDQDEIMDSEACETLAGDLRNGGSAVTIARFDARHRWDGTGRSWRAPVHIADCRFRVGRDGTVSDERTMLMMTDPAMRAAILAFCSNRDGYLIGSDETVRVQSNAALAAFLNPVLFPPDGP